MARKITTLEPEEQKRLILLIRELSNRGIPLPQELLGTKIVWPTDSNGFFVRKDGIKYNPNENQLGFVDSNARFVAFISGRGGGKTASGSQKALRKIMQGYSGAVLNPDFENFKLSTWPEFRDWIPWNMVVPVHRYRQNIEWEPHQPFTLVFMNGAKVICKGLKDPDSARGPNINWLWYDEAGRDRDGIAWQNAVASVRVGKEPQAWVTTTPKGRLHWIYTFFEKQDISDESKELFEKEGGNRELIDIYYTTIRDNLENLDPGFVAAMLAAFPAGYLRDQEIDGKFVDERGSIGDRSWFNGKVIPQPWSVAKKRLRYWDLAATEKKTSGKKSNDPDETVGSLVAWDGEIKFVLEHQVSGWFAWSKIKETILKTAELDGPFVSIRIEQEPASGGKNQVAELTDLIKTELGPGWDVEGYRPEGDRVMAANHWFAEAAMGRWEMVQGNWNDGFLDQLSGFPDNSKHDDKITSVSGARLCIAPIRKWKSIPFLKV